MAKDSEGKAPVAQRVWDVSKILGVLAALAGGSYGTFGTADEGAVREVLTETLDELEDLRDEVGELRKQAHEDQRQMVEFLLNLRMSEGAPDLPEVLASPPPPSVPTGLKGFPEGKRVQKARKMLDGL